MVYQLEPLEEGDNPKEKVEPIEEKPIQAETPVESASAEKEAQIETTQEVAAAEKDNSYSKILSKVKTAPAKNTDEQEVASDAQAVSQKSDAESQIQHLVDVAMQKGVIHAVKVAQHMEDNYILDMFHDKLLSEELHDALVKKGLIKEE
jgi:hypothetical protein